MLEKKTVYSYYTLWKNSYQHKAGTSLLEKLQNLRKSPTINKVFKESDVIIVPSSKSGDWLKSEMSDKDIRVIPHGINLKKFTLTREDEKEVKVLKEKYALKNKKVLGYVGRLSSEKNITETIDNLAELRREVPNAIFMIVGTGEADEYLRAYVKKVGLEESVIFVGEVPHEKLKFYYALFDVFVTAANFETHGLAYFEAAATGTVLLARKDRAIENIFFNGYNSYLYEDSDDWKDKIMKALFGDNEKLIKAAKETVKDYSSDLWAKKIEEIYKKLN